MWNHVCARPTTSLCGCSSMVEPQSSKLATRVRFSSPARNAKGPQPQGFRGWGPSSWLQWIRAACPPPALRGREQRPGGPVLVIQRAPITGLGFPLDYLVQPVGDLPSPLVRGVLVDQRRPHRRVPHALHQLASRRATHRGQVITGVTQVMEREPRRKTGLLDPSRPLDRAPPAPRFGVPPREPVNTNAVGSSGVYFARCTRSSLTSTVGIGTVRTPAADFGGPTTRRPPLCPTQTPVDRLNSTTDQMGSNADTSAMARRR
jgi:hypothetical protein